MGPPCGDGSSPRSERRRASDAKQVPVLAPGSLVTKPQSLHTSHVLADNSLEAKKERALKIATAVQTKLPHGPLNRELN